MSLKAKHFKKVDLFNKKLEDDNFYYGKVRNYAVSASNIGNILDGTFGSDDSGWKLHYEIGKYFHVQTLEPDKLDKFDVRDVDRRKPGDQYLKESEVEKIKAMKVSHDADVEARGILYGPGVEYEVPGFVVIEGVLFIGKADIKNPQIGYLGDLKSTRSVDDFDSSIRKWYGPQLWLYYKIFGSPTAYVVTEKTEPYTTEVVYPAKHFYASGKAKVLEAIEKYKEDYPEHYARNVELQKSLGVYV